MSSAALKEAEVEADPAEGAAEVANDPGGAAVEGAEKAQPSEAEARARRMGWHPKDEYEASGRDASRWVSAEDFIARGEAELPVLRDRNRNLDKKVGNLEKKLDEGHALLRDLVASQAAREKKAVEKAISELKAERRAASQAGDTERVEALSTEIEETQAAAAAAKPVEQRQEQARANVPQEVVDWAEANPWFNTNRAMHAIAVAHYGDLLENPATKKLNETEKLARVKAEVVKRFPEAFANSRRSEAPAVESGNGGVRRPSGGKTWNDIPAEDRAIGARLIKAGAVKDQAAYAKDYFA